MKTINSFRGANAFLSNFYPAKVEFRGETYPSVEAAYMSAKSNDTLWKQYCLDLRNSPSSIKQKSKKIKLVDNWESIKLKVMEECLRSKFSKTNPYLVRMLLATYPKELIEGNTWGDTFWGICKGTGENHLGKLLMKIRAEFITN